MLREMASQLNLLVKLPLESVMSTAKLDAGAVITATDVCTSRPHATLRNPQRNGQSGLRSYENGEFESTKEVILPDPPGCAEAANKSGVLPEEIRPQPTQQVEKLEKPNEISLLS